MDDIKNHFASFLLTINESFNDKNGLFIVIDDINGLSKTPEFANWYKGLSETIDFSEKYVPVAITLVSYRENFDKFTMHNPSFTRIFNLIEIDKLKDEDIKTFFIENFGKYDMKFEDERCLSEMIYYSWGMPLAMQQIGEEVFWNVEDGVINEKAVLAGILNAAFVFGNKQIKLVLNQIEEDVYEDILLKLGKNKLMEFKKSELEDILSEEENKILENFLSRMKELNIIEHLGKEIKEEYTFTNRLYFVYFLILANIN